MFLVPIKNATVVTNLFNSISIITFDLFILTIILSGNAIIHLFIAFLSENYLSETVKTLVQFLTIPILLFYSIIAYVVVYPIIANKLKLKFFLKRDENKTINA